MYIEYSDHLYCLIVQIWRVSMQCWQFTVVKLFLSRL